MSDYPCALADGVCAACGNDTFYQQTTVKFEPTDVKFNDADGRRKRQANSIAKTYQCCRCGARYAIREFDDSYVQVG